jgi:hypothetical protein
MDEKDPDFPTGTMLAEPVEARSSTSSGFVRKLQIFVVQ